MISGLFRRASSEALVQRLYGALVDASRRPWLYARLGVPDTFEGRFECLTLHATLVLRHLQASEAPGPALAQDLVDAIFAHFDRTLREMGVGDISVPKRMRQMAEAFLGRSSAYEAALTETTPGGLASTLSRNIGAVDASGLERYVVASAAALDAQPLSGFLQGHLPFPDLAAWTTADGIAT